ncbi:glycosyltransferase family 2 protein [Proteus faecis]|uniref:glycosyltransferase family 2 protein n=1 Tax=Proteus faecis TaxID=2050967 RepID=UPI0021BB637E|nr:glycosyltransferase family 2 protein [Proteus faecis]MCT8249411.1 glycosyltransferase family 2 protein [Proteus faecis]
MINAIIITYNPDINILKKNILTLSTSKKINEIIIIDNSDDADYSIEFSKINNTTNRVKFFILKENKGIAFAQNIGLKYSAKNGLEYAILFDQDSFISNDLINLLLIGIKECNELNINIAAVGPRPYDILEKRKSKSIIQKENIINKNITVCSQIIASGKLINLSCLNTVGLMDEDLFIDGVDHEWCWRAKRKGYNVAIIENAIMQHTLGDSRGNFLGLTYKIGAPIRLYYQFRNIIILSRRNYVPSYWKVRNLLGMIFRFIIFSCSTNEKKTRRKYMIKGLIDGLKNKKGSVKSSNK